MTKSKKDWDVLIVGAGLYGAACAHELTKKGFRCLVFEKRGNIGGNCYTENRDGINLHLFGAHIFHTSNQKIWEWITQFARFNHYHHTVKVEYEGKRYSFPFNLETFYQIWGVKTPEEAKKKLDEVRIPAGAEDSLESHALSQVGTDIYNIFIKGYTEKQWGTDPRKLPSSIIKRIPVRLNYNDSYFSDTYQGIPIGGYTPIIEKLLQGSEVRLGVDYLANPESFNVLADKVLFTGPIDAFFNFQFGKLLYRSMSFKHRRLEMEDFQGMSVINYTSEKVPFTRIIEHKHFEFGTQPVTWVSEEYSQAHGADSEPMYPVRDEENLAKLRQYQEHLGTDTYKNFYFGGRLAEYLYYDMHQAIGGALKKSEQIAADLSASK
jgi:UDP-galactopyranose mutase